MRPRLASMPSPSLRRVVSPKRPSLGQLRVRASGKQDEWRERIRCFKITSKGLVRERDCYVTPPVSPPGDGSGETKCLLANIGRNNVDAATRENDDDCAVCQPQYTIVVVGSKGVGKTHIIRQFQTPVNHANISCSFGECQSSSVNHCRSGYSGCLFLYPNHLMGAGRHVGGLWFYITFRATRYSTAFLLTGLVCM